MGSCDCDERQGHLLPCVFSPRQIPTQELTPFSSSQSPRGTLSRPACESCNPDYWIRSLTPLLEKNATNTNPGRVINISSVAGLDPKAQDTGLADAGTGLWSCASDVAPSRPALADRVVLTDNTSKAAANHLTSTLAVTLGPKKVTVNAILPGVFPSKMTQYGIDKEGDKLAASHPMGSLNFSQPCRFD